jgi:hypothetical protein
MLYLYLLILSIIQQMILTDRHESFNSMSPDSAKSSPDATSPEKGVLSDSQESQEDNSPQKKKKKSARRKKKNGEEGTEGMWLYSRLVVNYQKSLGQHST